LCLSLSKPQRLHVLRTVEALIVLAYFVRD
jgi:hypothetical protein